MLDSTTKRRIDDCRDILVGRCRAHEFDRRIAEALIHASMQQGA